MKILNIKPEDFTNYKKPSMFIGMGTCSFKCCREAGISPDIFEQNLKTCPQFTSFVLYLNIFLGIEPF